MNQQRNTIPQTIMSHMTTNPRLALKKDADGITLVPSFDRNTGKQDVQVAGTIVSIEPGEGYINPESGLTYYKAKADVNFGDGVETEKTSVLLAGSQIDKIKVGATYWMTVRQSKDGNITNLSCAGLSTDTSLSGDKATALFAMFERATENATPIAATA
jgi:hypothetical protein